jgi:hypothetical protein
MTSGSASSRMDDANNSSSSEPRLIFVERKSALGIHVDGDLRPPSFLEKLRNKFSHVTKPDVIELCW